jgi:hypothetical protein
MIVQNDSIGGHINIITEGFGQVHYSFDFYKNEGLSIFSLSKPWHI